jgi:hypothetical protein
MNDINTDKGLNTQDSHADARKVDCSLIGSGPHESRCRPQLGEIRRMRLAEHSFIMSERMLQRQDMV